MAPEASPQQTALQQRSRDGALAQLRRAREWSRSFVERLRDDCDPYECEFYFDRLSSALDEVRDTARDAVPQDQVMPHLRRIAALRLEIAAQLRDATR